MDRELKIFSGGSNPELAQKICDYLDIPMGMATISHFPDGETFIKLEEDVRGRDIFVVQSIVHTPNNFLMEMLIYLDCVRRASAERVTAVLPYYGYARQDRKDEGRTPITAKLVANMLVTAGADRVLTVDLHANQIQGFFDVPLDHLLPERVFVEHFRQLKLDDLTIVSPDVGSVKRARLYAKHLEGELAIVDKERLGSTKVRSGSLIGSVEERNVIIFDDMISTAGSVTSAAALVKERGAKDVYVAATHGILCGPGPQRLAEAPIKQVVVTDTVPLTDESRKLRNLTVLSVAPLVGEAISRIHRQESVSSLFMNDV
ncbi:MAG: ribose-phosphate pyrophosphokinase [Planctomycetes bacterium]|nr:ribose-phosphate pyrophosphokinase [Planctomycetota bacterium]